MEKLPRFSEERELARQLKSPEAVEHYERLFIAAELKKHRRRKGAKQGALAKQLKTSQSAIARIESGKQNISLRMLIRTAFALGKRVHIRFQ